MRALARALEGVRMARSRRRKEELLAEALADVARGASRDLPEEGGDPGRHRDGDAGAALATAARLAVSRPLPVGDPRPLGVSGALLFEVACRRTGIEAAILAACARRCGDLGEAFGLLIAADPRGDAAGEGLSLPDVARLFDALAATPARADKLRLLEAAFRRTSPVETKYLAKALLGALRVGAHAGVLEVAIARAFERPLAEVRRALARVTDPGVVAVLAWRGALDEADLTVGRPVAFMLATPLEACPEPASGAPGLFEGCVVEDKIDGIRAQLHKRGDAVTVFARGLEAMTGAFPEIVGAARAAVGSFVLDGEIVVLGEGGRPRPFQALQPRLRKAAPPASLLATAPVTFVAFDLLYDDRGEGPPHLLDLPWAERRRRLDAFTARVALPPRVFAVNPSRPFVPSPDPKGALDRAFEAARARGAEGVVLKREGAAYEAGRRGHAWIKVKRPFATLDVVITAAEEGHGRRAGTLSDYTFAVWRGDELVNVGKAYTGLRDDEIERLGRALERATVARAGALRTVRPELVLEVAFDGVQRSARHASGYALRFPRIVRWRTDKRPDEADHVAAVEAIHRASVASGHREERAATHRRKKKGEVSSAQLSLFDAKPARS